MAQTATVAGLNQHSAARNASVFVLKTDNFWFVPRQYSSVSEHIHSMFAACLLTVHTSKHHVLGCCVRLCRGICSIVCTGLIVNQLPPDICQRFSKIVKHLLTTVKHLSKSVKHLLTFITHLSKIV